MSLAVPIETIAVIGSGIMGRGIAHAAAVGGFRAILHDVSAEALDRAAAHIRRDLDEGVTRGKITAAHAARALVGSDYRRVLPTSMLLAPILLLAADVVGRVVARPGEVQVAIVTAVLGAPVFVAIVRRHRLAGL